ncbi:hypothetical protein [Tianweitania sediminis]|jgi:hypothetical protein|uniref:Uncharacterized protein n=1 Tax=Tianweitania sediminis TaxID=1502156 RepID=A0A8J7QZ83_9HYPH|nr:hypothetical protein [Tianweitania sediminis]MBP0438725.1 hypothetical protein [Tianweitania sediminis]HEV7415242.1 hypothetical protein [Tianweitania sediminis]
MRLLRNPIVLAVAAVPVALIMLALEFLYLRPLTNGQSSLDWRFDGFKPMEALSWLTALGPRGREALLVWHYLTADLVFPFLVGFALAGFTFYAAREVPRLRQLGEDRLQLLCILWIVPYLLADYGSNGLISAMLIDPVGVSHSLIRTASVFVILKHLFFGIGLVMLAGLVWFGRRARSSDRA